MCDSKDHMNHMHEGCGCSKDAASGKMEEGKKAMKDAYEKSKEGRRQGYGFRGVSDKAKSMMDKDKNA